MATVEAHYQDVLSGVYSWMLGGFDVQIAKNRTFFENHHLHPKGSSVAIDLGAGCGFQSIPLAEMGYSVTAIDLDENLLRELKENDVTKSVSTIRDDLINFDRHVTGFSELIVCMTDTLLHLQSKDKVKDLFKKVANHLNDSGRFVITFRDLSIPLDNLDRFIPVKQDDCRILTCYLEYEPDTVKVHDLFYLNTDGQWILHKSFYRKLRLSPGWVRSQLDQAGFTEVDIDVEDGLVTMIAGKANT
jgi:hypothetical protein